MPISTRHDTHFGFDDHCIGICYFHLMIRLGCCDPCTLRTRCCPLSPFPVHGPAVLLSCIWLPRSHLVFTLSFLSRHLVTPLVYYPVPSTNTIHGKHGPTSTRSGAAGDCKVNILSRGAVQRPIGFSYRPGDTSRQRGIQYGTNCGEYARRCA